MTTMNQEYAPDTDALKYFPADEALVSVPLQKPKSSADRLYELLQSLEARAALPDHDLPPRGSFDSNQRQYSRCPIFDEGTAASFTANGRTFECQIVEMSIGGFGIVLPRSATLMPGIEGKLRAPGLNYIVGITRLEIRPEGTYIGLKKVEELVDYQEQFCREHSRSIGYLIAGLVGAVAVAICFHLMRA